MYRVAQKKLFLGHPVHLYASSINLMMFHCDMQEVGWHFTFRISCINKVLFFSVMVHVYLLLLHISLCYICALYALNSVCKFCNKGRFSYLFLNMKTCCAVKGFCTLSVSHFFVRVESVYMCVVETSKYRITKKYLN